MEKTPGGYNGKILSVNLSDKSVRTESIDETFCRKYLGGAGFIAHFLLQELPPGTDPLGPENKLIFATGPITGANIMGAGRNCVGAKSPLSGGIILSEVGEFWGVELKNASYDAIIIEGKADKPVYLWVHDGEASLKDAVHLWGKDTKATQQAIRSELRDDKVRVALIGPAGENMVSFACIMNGLYDAAGRGGAGAVMGSKNLKAIAVRGNKAVPVADPDRLKELRQWLLDDIYKHGMPRDIHDTGTGGQDMEMMEADGNLPVRNFRDGLFPEVRKIHGGVIKETIRVGMEGCYGCPVRCKKIIKFDEPYSVDPAYGGPEYETLAALGSNCGIGNVKAIVKGNELCNAYSLDTISTGVVISFAMECFEKGLLTTRDTGGIELRFGNDEAMLKCIELIAKREGLGRLLAEGTARMALKIGHQSEEFAINVKGVEAGLHEPRLKPSLGLGFMVNPHGADHVCNLHDPAFSDEMGMKPMKPLGLHEVLPIDEMSPRKVALFRYEQLKMVLTDCLLLCMFTAIPFDNQKLADLTSAVTGWDTGIVEQLRTAERVLTMARLFNVRQGLTADDDRLPGRFFQPKTDGPLSNRSLDAATMEKAKSYYYTLMGWDARTGVPLPEKLEELGIA